MNIAISPQDKSSSEAGFSALCQLRARLARLGMGELEAITREAAVHGVCALPPPPFSPSPFSDWFRGKMNVRHSKLHKLARSLTCCTYIA